MQRCRSAVITCRYPCRYRHPCVPQRPWTDNSSDLEWLTILAFLLSGVWSSWIMRIKSCIVFFPLRWKSNCRFHIRILHQAILPRYYPLQKRNFTDHWDEGSLTGLRKPPGEHGTLIPRNNLYYSQRRVLFTFLFSFRVFVWRNTPQLVKRKWNWFNHWPMPFHCKCTVWRFHTGAAQTHETIIDFKQAATTYPVLKDGFLENPAGIAHEIQTRSFRHTFSEVIND